MYFLEEANKSSPCPPSFARLARVVECGHKGDFWGALELLHFLGKEPDPALEDRAQPEER